MVYFGGFLPNWDISRGFLSVYIIYNAGGISAAAMAGDIFFSLAAPVGDDTGPILCFFAGFFLYIIRQKV